MNSKLLKEYVLLRGHDSGVWAGVLENIEIEWENKIIGLSDARMIWRFWANEGIALSAVAMQWLKKDCDSIKILNTIPYIELMDNRISTIIPCSKETEKQIREYEVAKQS